MGIDALALNPQGLDGLRSTAHKDGGRESVRAAAEQFESYFLQMMLRSMRETLAQDGPFDSQETKMFSDMFDQQIAQSIAKGKGIGLADMLVQQIEASMASKPGLKPQPRPYDLPPVDFPETSSAWETATAASAGNTAVSHAGDGALNSSNFGDRLWPHAVNAANELGVSPHVLLAQAALESGWGRGELRDVNGNSYNLFNIKAGKNWSGATVESSTTEYLNGKAVQQTASFRAYASYAEAFNDYARLIKDNPRYAQALSSGSDAEGYARGLQSAGYATDPGYAAKVMRVLNSGTFRASLSTDPLA